jgi:hypothetical protein
MHAVTLNIDVQGAATAAACAGPAPEQGLCWCYAPSRQQGFWDVCQ